MFTVEFIKIYQLLRYLKINMIFKDFFPSDEGFDN